MSYSIIANNSLVNGLGGSAGFGENQLTRNDDYSSSAIDITSIFPNGLNFKGQNISQLWVNNNGNLSFNSSWYTYTPPSPFTNTVIAPFWADVDTRSGAVTATPGGNSTGSNLVYYDLDTTNRVFTATWDDVGYYSYGVDKLNAFQVQLIDRGASSGIGENFDIVFRYEAINWTTGSASGGSGGLGGTVAQAGWLSAPSGSTPTGGVIAGSGDQASMLALDTAIGNYGVAGVYVFQVRNGTVSYGTSSGSPDAGYGHDAPDLSSAYAVNSGTTYTSNIDVPYDLDFYSFVPTTSGLYTFSSTGSTDVVGGILTRPDFSGTLISWDDDNGEGLNFNFAANLTAGQTYYLGVSAFRGGTGAYNFTISNPGAASETVSGGSGFGTATVIETGVNYTEYSPTSLSAGAIDVFQFTPTTSGNYTFNSNGSLDMIGALFSVPNMITGLMTFDDNSGTDNNFSMTAYLTAGHTYYAATAVMSGSSSGSYGFSITAS